MNRGSKPQRYAVMARVGETPVEVLTPDVYLIPDTPPTTIQIRVPRPALGDLVKAFADEKDSRSREWRELIYDAEENRARHEIQQRRWRIHRGAGTEADARAELQAELLRRRDEQ